MILETGLELAQCYGFQPHNSAARKAWQDAGICQRSGGLFANNLEVKYTLGDVAVSPSVAG